MPRPHTHPSLNCYIHHGCRCKECQALKAEANRRHRRNRIERGAVWRWDPARQRSWLEGGMTYVGKQRMRVTRTKDERRPLPPDEVVRLREMLGLPPEGPPPERRGRPRKERRERE